ncbi:CBS domain-containing protein [Arthrobacter sp.]|uniref:CBS domain-containing protein n=1 Tax=Arthrobacter sp. TaxID=1667 RepID=UPI002898B54B|nr:CBS domain-containing protein [Arthrobacter sp.]
MAIKAPYEPTVASGFEETQKYLEFLRSEARPLEIRRLIGYWGFKGRGKNSINIVTANLAQMGLRTEPPFDSGSLDSLVTIQKLSEEAEAYAERPDDHLLTVSRIPSASFALPRQSDDSAPAGIVYRDTSIADAVTIMLKYDYSQLPVVDSKARRDVLGVFTWQSYAQATLRGEKPTSVGAALVTHPTVDLHSDLFASVEPIAREGYILVTYRGYLAGIVTASDLTLEFEDLALPFLAVGQCEQELKRVAKGKLAHAKDVKGIEDLTFGGLQYFYKENWDSLGWSLSLDEFFDWLETTRNLRNSIAHFDNQDKDSSSELETVHRLTRWLRSVITNPEVLSDGDEAASVGKAPTP